jgi:NADH-quinone oxidoreductase subunit G
VPAFANGRGLREAGVLPSARAGLQAPQAGGRDAGAIAEGLAAGDLAALYLLHCDPLRDLAHGELWRRALARATTVVAHASFLTEGIREHATVVFPAEAYAEKDGTVVHPDGRVQRLRAAIERPHGVRAEWTVLAELAATLGFELGLDRESAASQLLYESVPFYAGLTAEEIGGRGVRWQERPAAASYPAASTSLRGPGSSREPDAPAGLAREDALELEGYRSVWDAPEVEFSPNLESVRTSRNGGNGASPRGTAADEAQATVALGAGEG